MTVSILSEHVLKRCINRFQLCGSAILKNYTHLVGYTTENNDPPMDLVFHFLRYLIEYNVIY